MRHLLTGLALLGALTIWRPAQADDAYPTRPIRVMVGFAPGGAADLTIRTVGQRLGERLGQPVVVDNRPSAGGILAAEAAASAPPDGYTLFFLTNGAAISQSLFKQLPFDTVADFAPISLIGRFDLVLVTANAAPYADVGEIAKWHDVIEHAGIVPQ